MGLSTRLQQRRGICPAFFSLRGCPGRGSCGSLEVWRSIPNMPVESAAATAITEQLHAWESGGARSAEAFAAWVGARLAAHEAALATLIAIQDQRTPENTLRLYDAAIEQLSLAGAQ